MLAVEDGGRVYRSDFEYEPWRLRPAEAEVAVDRLGEGAPALLRFSEVQDVRFGPPVLA